MQVSPGFANLFNNFEASSGTKVPLIHEMYLVIYHTLCLGGSGGIWLTSLLVIFVAMLPYLIIEPIHQQFKDRTMKYHNQAFSYS